MADKDSTRHARRRRVWLAGLLTAVVAGVAAVISGAPPPGTITLATGQPGGMYDRFGAAYATRLQRVGLRTEVAPSNGSLDNLQRLLRGEVDAAFVQSGTYRLVSDPEGRVRGIAALYSEPLWVFHRGGVRSLSALADRPISIGPPASGTEAVAAALLRAHGIDPAGSKVERLRHAEARARLEQGSLDAAFFVTSYSDPLVGGLLRQPGIGLLSFEREKAYTRTFPALTPLKLYAGMLDLQRDLPAQDMTLLAPTALLAGRAGLHPRVVEQLLKAAQAIHGPGSLLDAPLRFPSREALDIPPHDAADVYLAHGESLLSRTLPYALLRWTPIVHVLVISVILWIPLVRALPELGRWRIDRRFGRLYALLGDADRRVGAARDAGELKAGLAALDRLSVEAQPLCDKMPGLRQRDVYDWRVHLAFVRSQAMARLAAMDEGRGSGS